MFAFSVQDELYNMKTEILRTGEAKVFGSAACDFTESLSEIRDELKKHIVAVSHVYMACD